MQSGLLLVCEHDVVQSWFSLWVVADYVVVYFGASCVSVLWWSGSVVLQLCFISAHHGSAVGCL